MSDLFFRKAYATLEHGIRHRRKIERRPCGRLSDKMVIFSYMVEPEAARCILISTFSVRPE